MRQSDEQSWSSGSPSAAISVFLICLHPDLKQENHTPVPAIIQGDVEFSAGSLEEWGQRKEDKVHPHMLVVAPKRPAVDKPFAYEVFVSNVQEAEDLYLKPVATPPSTVEDSLLHAPHHPSNVMLIKLIMLADLPFDAGSLIRMNQWLR